MRRWWHSLGWSAIAVMAAVSCLVPSALVLADQQRQRPWPDEWPIILPPVLGPLPAPPPPAPPTRPATPSAERVMETIRAVRANLRSTRYQHHRVVRERDGVYYWDCSLMVTWMLERAAPRSLATVPGGSRRLAASYARAIERAPTDRFARGWQRIDHIESLRPGDVFAWRRPPHFPSNNSGHVGFVVEAPRRVPQMPGAYAVRIADATSTGHQNDTRPYPGEGGFGIGTLVFLTDGDGHGTHYGWAGTYSGGYVVTPILFGRVGPR
ncbi:MAG: hypothetical protein AB7S26_25255 [Sandaracinaceae bacterium]